jgi:hypothetical protein
VKSCRASWRRWQARCVLLQWWPIMRGVSLLGGRLGGWRCLPCPVPHSSLAVFLLPYPKCTQTRMPFPGSILLSFSRRAMHSGLSACTPPAALTAGAASHCVVLAW